MSLDLLEKFIQEYLELFSGKLVFNWHGGEPLLAGLSFFKKIVELQAKYINGQTIRNTVQTNATLINDEWASFFKAHNFRLGVSLDGDKRSHNRFRKCYGGGESFDKVIRGIKTLQRHNIKFGIIQTLVHDNVNYAKENFGFLTNVLGIKSFGVNAYLDVKNINKPMLSQVITNEDLIMFLKTYIDLWLNQDDPDLQIREIDNFITGIAGKRAKSCNFNGSCANFFCVEHDGKVYSSCDRFSNHPDLLIGNLFQQSLSGILNGDIKLRHKEEMNSIHLDCVVCELRKICHNGCTYHRVGGISGKYYFCETRKAIFSYLKEKLGKNEQALITH